MYQNLVVYQRVVPCDIYNDENDDIKVVVHDAYFNENVAYFSATIEIIVDNVSLGMFDVTPSYRMEP